MKIKYNKEENNTATVCSIVCIVLIGLAIVNLIIGNMDKLHLMTSLSLFGVAALIFFASRLSAKEVNVHKNERKRIISQGNCISGKVIERVERRTINKYYRTHLKISCFSTILNREVIFETPALYSEFEEYEGLTCTIYEAYENPDYPPRLNMKPMLSIQPTDGNMLKPLRGNVVDGVTFLADKLENAEKKKTKLSDVLWVIFVIAFFIAAGYFCMKQ